MKVLPESKKMELLMFVLERTDISSFNTCTREFRVQPLYSRHKRELKSTYPDIMGSELDYAIVMADVFRPYQCDGIECPKLVRRIDALKRFLPKDNLKAVSYWPEKVIEHDLLVTEYSKLLQPQNELIKIFKKVIRAKKKLAKTPKS